MLYSGKCESCQSLYGRGTEKSNPGYALSNQQYGSAGSSITPYSLGGSRSSGSKGSYHSSPKSSSIDDLLPYQGMRPMPKITDGFYSQLGDAFYVPGQQGDFGVSDFDRAQKGYGVNSKIEQQYGFNK